MLFQVCIGNDLFLILIRIIVIWTLLLFTIKNVTNKNLVKTADIINNDYLRCGENININDIFNKWAAKKDDNKLVIGNSIRILYLLEFYTCIKELRETTYSMLEKCQNIGRVDLTWQQLTQLRKDLQNFSLVSFDKWKADLHTTTTWRKKWYQTQEILSMAKILTRWICRH